MKVALLSVNDEHQIMFKPESDSEKAILGLLLSDKDIKAIGGSYTDKPTPYDAFPERSRAGYYRQFSSDGCAMLVVTDANLGESSND